MADRHKAHKKQGRNGSNICTSKATINDTDALLLTADIKLRCCIGKFSTIDIYVCAYNYMYAVYINIQGKDMRGKQMANRQTVLCINDHTDPALPTMQLMRHIIVQSVSPQH